VRNPSPATDRFENQNRPRRTPDARQRIKKGGGGKNIPKRKGKKKKTRAPPPTPKQCPPAEAPRSKGKGIPEGGKSTKTLS